MSVDILARKGRGQSLIEVRSDTSIKPHHLWEVAVQAYVLRRAGVVVNSVEIMHLNDECRFPDMAELFVTESISGRVRGLYPQLSKIISSQVAVLDGPLPEIAVGDPLRQTYKLPAQDRCWPTLPKTPRRNLLRPSAGEVGPTRGTGVDQGGGRPGFVPPYDHTAAAATVRPGGRVTGRGQPGGCAGSVPRTGGLSGYPCRLPLHSDLGGIGSLARTSGPVRMPDRTAEWGCETP